MLPKEVVYLLKKVAFVTVATSSPSGRPNAGPKFLLDIKGHNVYLVDYAATKTLKNIQKNPKAVISVIDSDSLVGYQVYGKAAVVKNAAELKRMTGAFKNRILKLSVDRVITAVKSGVRSKNYELSIPSKVLIIRIKVQKISIISPTGSVKNEKIGRVRLVVKRPVLTTTLPTVTVPLLVPSALGNIKEEIKVEKK